MASKSLDSGTNAEVRRLLGAVVADDFGGNQSTAALKLGVKQPYISDILNKRRGAGVTLLEALARQRGMLVDRVLGRAATDLDVALDYHRKENFSEAAVKKARDALQGGLKQTPKAWAGFLADETKALAAAQTQDEADTSELGELVGKSKEGGNDAGEERDAGVRSGRARGGARVQRRR